MTRTLAARHPLLMLLSTDGPNIHPATLCQSLILFFSRPLSDASALTRQVFSTYSDNQTTVSIQIYGQTDR